MVKQDWRDLPKVTIYVCSECGGLLEQVNPDEPVSCRADPETVCSVNPAHSGIITRGQWQEHGAAIEADEVRRNYPHFREPPMTKEEARAVLEKNTRLLRGDPEFEGFD